MRDKHKICIHLLLVILTNQSLFLRLQIERIADTAVIFFRDKLLDLIGDLRLTGGFLQAKVTAYKSGHTINTAVAKMVREKIK